MMITITGIPYPTRYGMLLVDPCATYASILALGCTYFLIRFILIKYIIADIIFSYFVVVLPHIVNTTVRLVPIG